MTWLKRTLIAIGLLIAIALVLPYFITFNDYIPQIEKVISAELQEPVSIKNIKFSSLPRPYLTVDGISVGTNEDITLNKIVLVPDIFSLLQSSIVIKSIEVESPIISQQAFNKLLVLSKSNAEPASQQSSPVRVESIHFINVHISAKKELSGRINADVNALGISTKVPLNVTGTIDSPLLYPTGATIAGAALGTAIMGPGVGTSVGAKVGGWVDNLFGGK